MLVGLLPLGQVAYADGRTVVSSVRATSSDLDAILIIGGPTTKPTFMSRKGKTTWFYCRHTEVSDNLPCHGLQVREKELEQVVFESIKAHVLPARGMDICKDDLTLQSVQQAEQEKKLRALQDSKRKLYERYALGEIDLDSYKAEKEKFDIALVGEKTPMP